MWCCYKRFRRNAGVGLGQCSVEGECLLNRDGALDSIPRARERREGGERKGSEREGDGGVMRT